MKHNFIFVQKLTRCLIIIVFLGIVLSIQPLLWGDGNKNHTEAGYNHSKHNEKSHETKLPSLSTAWNVVQSSVKEIETLIAAKNLKAIHKTEEKLSEALRYMQSNSSMVTGDKAKRLQSALKQTMIFAANVHSVSDAGDQEKTEAEFKKLASALKLVEVQYPADVLKTSDNQNMNSMNHQDSSNTHTASSEVTTLISVTTDKPLKVGEKITASLKLSKKDGSPMLLSDLKEAHTEKIHLLIIDPSLTDYHHEHPKPTSTPGEYTFNFTPQKSGSYRVWADLIPIATDTQEYAMTDIAAPTQGEPFTNREVKTVATVDGLKYELTFEKPIIKVGEAALGKLKITTSEGKVFTQLEPVMGAYAHIVGFSDDYKSIAHIHPMGEEPTKPTDRGVGELKFHLLPSQPGIMRLFAQVQINGVNKFADFTLEIKP